MPRTRAKTRTLAMAYAPSSTPNECSIFRVVPDRRLGTAVWQAGSVLVGRADALLEVTCFSMLPTSGYVQSAAVRERRLAKQRLG